MCQTLKEKVNPEMITVCRSVYSRFTTHKQVDFIEKELIKKLQEIYHIKIVDVNKLGDSDFN